MNPTVWLDVAALGRLEEGPGVMGEPEWLTQRRATAAAAFRARGLPTGKDEAWRFTPLGLFKDPALLAPGASGIPVVTEPLPDGVVAARISEAARALPAVEQWLARLPAAEHAFTWLNTALFRDGLFLHARSSDPASTVVQVGAPALPDEASASYERTLVVVDPGCRLTLIERYQSDAPALVNSAIELVLSEGATVEHLRVQSGSALHLGMVAVWQARGSRYGSRVFSLGGPFARLDLTLAFDGEGAECELDGFFALRGREHADLYTVVDHRSPRCTSLERYKGLLTDQARGVFDGTILVQKGAVGTNARQESRNLLLSNDAIVNTKPHLEIDADDVKCGHGATVGHLDEQQLFYLGARGIERKTAQAMLAFGFAQDILYRARVPADLKRELFDAVIARVPGGERLEAFL